MAYPPPLRIEVTRAQYKRITGCEPSRSPYTIGAVLYGPLHYPIVEYLFIDRDGADHDWELEVRWLEKLHELEDTRTAE